jgi:hypothetical protein
MQQPLAVDFPAQRRDRRLAGSARIVVRCAVTGELIDERRVESLLAIEDRRDEAPDEPAQAALERAIDRRIGAREDVGLARQIRRRCRVACRQRRRNVRILADRAIKRRQGVVIGPIGRKALALEAREAGGERLRRGRRMLGGAAQPRDPITPATGLLAVA